METRDSIVIRFEGSAGDGVLSMGTIVAKTAARCGFHVCTLSSFLAEVRGGQSSFQLKLGCSRVSSPGDAPDIVVALNAKGVENQKGAIRTQGLLFCPPACEEPPPAVTTVVVDYDAIATAQCGNTRNKNLVAAGALMQVLGVDRAKASAVVRRSFSKKGEAVAEAADQALGAGFELSFAARLHLESWRLKSPTGGARLLISGNEAVSLGSIVGGIRFFAGYPITPASEIMEALAKHLPEVGGRAVQAEDEIASLGMCIGAAFGGAKALTATSGPGLSLMVELLGLAGMAELPLVVVDVQRAGPSTGMPTKDGQADLNLAVYGAHGDAPRVVLAPQSVSDCFDDAVRAVRIAHQFHLPVILLSSQSLSHRMQTVELPSLDSIQVYEEPLFDVKAEHVQPFRRYRATNDGEASLRSVPGIASGMYRTGGLEHDESGQPCFDVERRAANVSRRRLRMNRVAEHFAAGSDAERCTVGDQRFALVSWGTTAGPAREAIERLRTEEGWVVGHYFPRLLWPLPKQAIAELIASGIDTLFVCEANDSQQFAQLISANCADELRIRGVQVVGIGRDHGIPLTATDIVTMLRNHLDGRDPSVALVG
jgi:2-oxoglutarate/2-oxoacid ferredoxin oxidoreductase subunit alpha